MCGRYELDKSDIDEFGARVKVKPNYNTAPTQTMPVFIHESKPEFVDMKWGIHRVIGPGVEKDIINTRADKAFSRFWNKTVRENRCLIPATGFYEWDVKTKQPYFIHPKDRDLYYFAGIYAEKDGVCTYSIMTTDPNKEMSVIHNRMPVILHRGEELKWLEDVDNLEEYLTPLEDGSLEMYEISRDVNNVRNNYPALSRPV